MHSPPPHSRHGDAGVRPGVCLPKLAATVAKEKYPPLEPPSDCPPQAHTSSSARWLFASPEYFPAVRLRQGSEERKTERRIPGAPPNHTISVSCPPLHTPHPREEKLGGLREHRESAHAAVFRERRFPELKFQNLRSTLGFCAPRNLRILGNKARF